MDDRRIGAIGHSEPGDRSKPLLERITGMAVRDSHIHRKTLRGGLEAPDVTLVTVQYRGGDGRRRQLRFVAKRLKGRTVREAAIYRSLAAAYADDFSPRLLAVEHTAPDRAVLYIEAIRRVRAWPWRNLSVARALLGRLARFHTAAMGAAAIVEDWDYEAELSALSEATWTAVDRCRLHPDLSVLARELPCLRRIVLARPALRRRLLSEGPFRSGPIHGDLHPGNALVCRRGRADIPVLVDWGRARIGSPLEDVSSWLLSLGYWEPEARRRHDTLLATYLAACGLEPVPWSQIRAVYWAAGASNALAGALLHHLQIAGDERRSPSQRAAGVRAARAQLRIVRRADAWWSGD